MFRRGIMKMLAIYNGTNKRFRHDGDEFEREAHAWCNHLYSAEQRDEPGGVIVSRDVRDGRVRAEIRKMTDGLDVLAIFDHGTPRGLPRMRESYKNVKGLASVIAGVTNKITIILYACSAGRGWWWWKPKNKRDTECKVAEYNPRDGYATALCCELRKLGVDAFVWAHSTAGHTTRNPHVVAVNMGICEQFVYRRRWVIPGTAPWKTWVNAMKTEYRFTFWR
jgi:hypothetical protein